MCYMLSKSTSLHMLSCLAGIFISRQIHFDLKFLSCLWLEACMVLLVPAQHRFCYLPVLIDSVFSRCFLVESGIFLVQLFYSNHIFR